jgi:trans-2,3-dihydro-3-hydroxyanthranilate isomerase
MERTYDFIQVDVFTRTRLQGNSLAVFIDARGLSDAEMQALAKEMNLSETTFIFPRGEAIEEKDGKKVRIFTVAEELPFAGHPTLGTALYLHASQPADKTALNQIILDLAVGKIPVRVDRNGEIATGRVDGASFGEMRQRDPEFGQILSREEVAQCLGIETDKIAPEWPSQVISTGLPFAIVPMRSTKILTELRPGFSAENLLKGSGAKFIYFLSIERGKDRLEARARMFFYGGEDPATGSAAGCAVSWMAKYCIAKSDEQVLIRQGVEMNRPSEIFVRAERSGEQVTNVRVGGYAVEILRGTVTL